jgi:hypothetical protein
MRPTGEYADAGEQLFAQGRPNADRPLPDQGAAQSAAARQ